VSINDDGRRLSGSDLSVRRQSQHGLSTRNKYERQNERKFRELMNEEN